MLVSTKNITPELGEFITKREVSSVFTEWLVTSTVDMLQVTLRCQRGRGGGGLRPQQITHESGNEATTRGYSLDSQRMLKKIGCQQMRRERMAKLKDLKKKKNASNGYTPRITPMSWPTTRRAKLRTLGKPAHGQRSGQSHPVQTGEPE